MSKVRLDGKLECKACGKILMDIPEGATEHTLIKCSQCGGDLGEWGILQDEFAREVSGARVLELSKGTITKQA